VAAAAAAGPYMQGLARVAKRHLPCLFLLASALQGLVVLMCNRCCLLCVMLHCCCCRHHHVICQGQQVHR
jgi:hypothetical protein